MLKCCRQRELVLHDLIRQAWGLQNSRYPHFSAYSARDRTLQRELGASHASCEFRRSQEDSAFLFFHCQNFAAMLMLFSSIRTKCFCNTYARNRFDETIQNGKEFWNLSASPSRHCVWGFIRRRLKSAPSPRSTRSNSMPQKWAKRENSETFIPGLYLFIFNLLYNTCRRLCKGAPQTMEIAWYWKQFLVISLEQLCVEDKHLLIESRRK